MNSNDYMLYVCDTETTGLDVLNDIIEISICRLHDNIQKTWCIKPMNTNTINLDALRVNGHKYDDIMHLTKYGKEVYKEAKDVIVEIENFLEEDNVPSSNRIIIAHNVAFDKTMLEQLWRKCNSFESYPFGFRAMDTMQMQFMIDFATGDMASSYSLAALTKKYGVRNEKAHSAAADTKATMEVFQKQMAFLKSKLHA